MYNTPGHQQLNNNNNVGGGFQQNTMNLLHNNSNNNTSSVIANYSDSFHQQQQQTNQQQQSVLNQLLSTNSTGPNNNGIQTMNNHHQQQHIINSNMNNMSNNMNVMPLQYNNGMLSSMNNGNNNITFSQQPLYQHQPQSFHHPSPSNSNMNHQPNNSIGHNFQSSPPLIIQQNNVTRTSPNTSQSSSPQYTSQMSNDNQWKQSPGLLNQIMMGSVPSNNLSQILIGNMSQQQGVIKQQPNMDSHVTTSSYNFVNTSNNVNNRSVPNNAPIIVNSNNMGNSSPNNGGFFSQLLANSNVAISPTVNDKMNGLNSANSSSINNNMNTSAESGESQFHPIACLCCRKIHKRCDKKLPVCTRCAQKGLNCEYKEPFFKKTGDKKDKKKRKKKGDIITMFNVGDEDENAVNAIRSIKQNTIETYCSIVCLGNPPFRQEDLEKLLLVGPQELMGRRDIFAFLLSVQSLCEMKFGYPDLAEETMTKARNVISQYFDDFDNPFVVCTYCHLAFFNAADGKTRQARGYLNFVDHYMSNWRLKHDANDSPYAEISGNLFQFSITRLNWMKLIVELISTETHPVPNISTIEKLSMDMLGLAMPAEWKEYLTYYQLTDSKNVDERLRTLELFGSLLHFAMGPQNHSVFSTKLHSLNNIIVINGIRATILLLSGCTIGTINGDNAMNSDQLAEHINLLEYASLAINRTTDEELFPFISPYLISFFLVSVKVNLEVCKMIDRGERDNFRPVPKIPPRDVRLDGVDLEQVMGPVDYYSIVAKDLRGLQVLRKRYRYVAQYVTDVEEFLARRSNQSIECMTRFTNGSINEPIAAGMNENKNERIGTFYSEMRKFMLTFNKSLGEALLLGQSKTKIVEPNNQINDGFPNHPALSLVMNGGIKPGNVNELTMFVSEMTRNVNEQAEALRDLSTPSSFDDLIELDYNLDPFQAHTNFEVLK